MTAGHIVEEFDHRAVEHVLGWSPFKSDDHKESLVQAIALALARQREAVELATAAQYDEVTQQNVGAAITAQKLLEIAETGVHHGTFGGEDVEAAAQAILTLHAKRRAFAERTERILANATAALRDAGLDTATVDVNLAVDHLDALLAEVREMAK